MFVLYADDAFESTCQQADDVLRLLLHFSSFKRPATCLMGADQGLILTDGSCAMTRRAGGTGRASEGLLA